MKTRILLGMPNRGHIPTSMVEFLIFMKIPDGVDMYYCMPVDKPHCIARNEIIQIASQTNMDYIFWLDDDNVPESVDVLKILLDTGKKIISGLVPSRKPAQGHHRLSIFNKQPDESDNVGPDQYMNIPEGPDVFEIETCGLGCCLVHKDIFNKVREVFQPMPTETRSMWYYILEDGIMSEEELDYKNIKAQDGTIRFKNQISEDLLFFERAKFITNEKIYATTQVLCSHIGTNKLITIEKHIKEKNKDLSLMMSGCQHLLGSQQRTESPIGKVYGVK